VQLDEKKKPVPLIIDCDAGFDDSLGVVIAMHFHRLGQYRLKAVTISNGNTQEDHPWNAIHVIVHEIFQQHDIPIYRMPPRRDEMVDFPFYGIDGHYGQVERYLQTYGGMTFPDTNTMNSQQYLCQQLIEEPNLVILVTGPLTNLNVCHHLIKPTHRIFMMGGAIDVPGNVPAAYRAEFNFATDPDAVRNVISHGNSVIIPLDCKMRFFTERVTDALKEKKNRFLIEVFKRFRQQVYRAVNGNEHDHECTEECISIYDAVASFVTYLTLFGGPIQLGQKSVTIDESGAVVPGGHSIQYCASNSLDPLMKLREVRAAGTDILIAALQAATKDFNESPPSIAPTLPPAHVGARNYERHSHSHDVGATSRDWMERSDGESDAEDQLSTDNPDNFIGSRTIHDEIEHPDRNPSSSGEDWMERSGGGSAAGSTSVDYSSSYSNPGSSYPDTPRSSYPDTPRSGNPAYHFPVEDEEAPRYYDGGENSDNGFAGPSLHGGHIFGPLPSTSPTMNHSPSSSRRPGIQGNPAYHFPVEDEEAPRYYDGGENSDSGFAGPSLHGNVIFGPPPSTSPTMNHSPSSSRRPESALSLYRYGANYCIQLMRRTIGRVTNGMFMRISMCFHSWNTRSATLAVKYGDETWKQEAELPFDTSSKIGRYGIQWVPDRITWTVDGVKIGEALHKAVDIPDSPLHIKIFVAPTVPRKDMKDLIEHQLHLYLADYEQFEQNKSKDELIVLGDSIDYSWRFWLLFLILCVAAIAIWKSYYQRKHQTVDGYILLEEDFNKP